MRARRSSRGPGPKKASGPGGGGEEREAPEEPAERVELEEPEEDREEPEPLELAFEGEVSVGPAEIALVTLDPTGTRLVRRGR